MTVNHNRISPGKKSTKTEIIRIALDMDADLGREQLFSKPSSHHRAPMTIAFQ
jgi:hypothetical protein